VEELIRLAEFVVWGVSATLVVELDKEVLLWHLRRESGKAPALCLSREEKCDGCAEVDRYDATQLARSQLVTKLSMKTG
jgi:hypothetical protein